MISSVDEKLLFTIIISGLIFVNSNLVRNEDICGQHNGRRLYLELGDQGIVYAKNVSFIKNLPRQNHDDRQVYVTNSSHDQCSLELVTCPSCAITVTFKSLSLPHSCGDVGMMMDSPCRCDYVWISEPPYEDVSGAPYCGLYSPIVYKTSTRTISITLLYSQSHRHAFTIEYTSERNRLHLTSSGNSIVNGVNGTAGGILNSPFFPARYPRDLGMEYIITCPVEIRPCRIRVLFSDFQLATVSIIEFYDWNGQRLDVSSGARFRPPIIVSSGPSLLIRFYANGGTGLGYKATIGHLYDKAIQPITDCGGYVENLGGAITMMDMAGHGTKTFDCIWLIRPPKVYLHMKTHMYLKVVTFADMAGNTELIIREGPTSALLPLEIIRHPASQLQPPKMKEHIAPVANGFHVSLRGTFGSTSRVAIAYSAFGYMDCFSGSDFLCQNHRCIPSQLNCDGFDHCGDNSDEPTTCFRDWDMEPQNKKWHMNKANYYFPKIDHYPDIRTATVVFVASSIGLIILISALIVLLYRMGARARQQRELQSRLQTISELLDGARIEEAPAGDDPPVYEAPPGYDEVVKVGYEHEGFWKKLRKNPHIESRSRSLQNQRSRDVEVPSRLRIFDGGNTSRNPETTSISVNSVQNVPESPPPPYVTPPGTVPQSFDSAALSRHNVINVSVPKTFRSNRSQSKRHRQNSLPSRDNSIHIQPSTSLDPEALGVYQKNSKTSSNPSAEYISSQLVNSSNAVQCTSQGYEENSKGREQEIIVNKINNQKSICKCEGACGCATSGLNNEIFRKKKILRLLGTGKLLSSQNLNLTSTTVSDIQSRSPVQSVAERINDIKKSSMYFKENYLGPSLSMVSACCSPSSVSCESRNSLQVISVNSSMIDGTNPSTRSSTPISVPKRSIESSVNRRDTFIRAARRSGSYDLESLYKSIRALDAFLARRSGDSYRETRRSQSVAAMIFGTSEINDRRNDELGFFNFVRGWRSSDV